MKTNQRIEDEIEQTLRSLDGIERATPKPFFFTRVQARLDRHTAPGRNTTWVFRPAYVMASLGLVLLLNLSAVVYIHDRVAQHEEEQESAGFSVEWELESDALNW